MDCGDRRYGAADPEGHHRYFGQQIGDLTFEEYRTRA
jgi:hypothetical protein